MSYSLPHFFSLHIINNIIFQNQSKTFDFYHPLQTAMTVKDKFSSSDIKNNIKLDYWYKTGEFDENKLIILKKICQ